MPSQKYWHSLPLFFFSRIASLTQKPARSQLFDFLILASFTDSTALSVFSKKKNNWEWDKEERQEALGYPFR